MRQSGKPPEESNPLAAEIVRLAAQGKSVESITEYLLMMGREVRTERKTRAAKRSQKGRKAVAERTEKSPESAQIAHIGGMDRV